MPVRHSKPLLSILLAGVCFSPIAATAQVGAEDEIIVTATKRAEGLLDIPIAVTVVDAEELDLKNASGFSDYLPSIPGVQFNPNGDLLGNSIAIRGVTDGTSSFVTQQPVALILDETLLTLSQGAINLDYSVFGVDQINVIKGPNSTLYGASSLGGTIKIDTSKPSLEETSGRLKGVLSSTEEGGTNYMLVGSVSTPLIEDQLGMEITAYLKDDAGFIDDPSRGLDNINDRETLGGRIALRYAPTDLLTVDLTGYYQKLESGSVDRFAPVTVGDLQSRPLLIDQSQEDEFILVNLVADYDLGFANLISATSYFDRETTVIQDVSNSFINPAPGSPFTTTTFAPADVFTQEVRLVSSGEGPFKWLVGGYYSFEDYTESTLGTVPGLFDLDSNYEYETIAVFGEVGYDITESIDISVGGRYTDYSTPVELNSTIFFFPSSFTTEGQEDDFSPRFAINYRFDNGSLYAQASRGFRLGQVNTPIPSLPGDNVPVFFGSDSLWNYEIGAKTRWADGRVTLNVAAYRIDWTGIQLTRTASTGFFFVDNIGNAEITGFEVESAIQLTPSTTATANIGILDAELVDTVPGLATAGSRLPGSPEFTASFSLQQDFTIAGKDGYARIDHLYYGEYLDAFSIGAPALENGDYDKTDIRIGIELDQFDVSLFATNVGDSRPILARTFVAGEEIATIQPRTFGLALGYDF